MYTPSNSTLTRLPFHAAGALNALRYQPPRVAKKPPLPPMGFLGSILPSLLQSCGRFTVRQPPASYDGASAPAVSPTANFQSWSNTSRSRAGWLWAAASAHPTVPAAIGRSAQNVLRFIIDRLQFNRDSTLPSLPPSERSVASRVVANEGNRNIGLRGNVCSGAVVVVIRRVPHAHARPYLVADAFERRHGVGKVSGVPVDEHVVGRGPDNGDGCYPGLVERQHVFGSRDAAPLRGRRRILEKHDRFLRPLAHNRSGLIAKPRL